jgi:flagellar hook-associated protein 3 FlgL
MDFSFYTNFNSSLTQQESQINVLQQEISSGLAVQTPDQNPAAFETATLGSDQVATLTNDNNTQATIQAQLGSVNDAYQSTTDLFNSVQSVLEDALNGTTSAQNLTALASQVAAASEQLQGIANTTSPNGTYLFGGSRSGVAPFQISSTGSVVYMGDGGQSQAAISSDTSASTIANGEVFVSSLSGDGTSTVTAPTSNTGTGQLIAQGTVSASAAEAFQASSTPASNITLAFSTNSSGATIYTATQNGAALVPPVTGTATANATIQLGGVNYELTGTPASGDSFTIAPSRPQSAFTLLQTIYTALSTAGSSPAQVAQTNQVLNQSLASLNQYQQAVITAQAQNGVTLQAITNAAAGNTDQSTQIQTSVTNATEVNTPVAITSLDETLTALQAAMKTFGDVQSLSLFSYL